MDVTDVDGHPLEDVYGHPLKDLSIRTLLK